DLVAGVDHYRARIPAVAEFRALRRVHLDPDLIRQHHLSETVAVIDRDRERQVVHEAVREAGGAASLADRFVQNGKGLTRDGADVDDLTVVPAGGGDVGDRAVDLASERS